MASHPPARKTRSAAAASSTRPARPAAKKAVPAAAPRPARKPARAAAQPAALVPAPLLPLAQAAVATGAARHKGRLVRDSFTMPEADFALVALLKQRALGFRRPTKKSELLRAGLQALAGLDDAALQAALDALVPLKPGRPKKAG